MKANVLLIVSLVIYLSKPCFSIEIDELRQVIEAMESAYIDISVDYTWDQSPPMTQEDIIGTGNLISIGKVSKTLITARPFSERSLSSEKVKLIDEHDRSFDSETKESYNGKIAKCLSIGGWPKPVTDGTITKRKDFMPKLKLSPLGFSVFRFYPEVLLSERLANTELCRMNSQIIKINNCNSISVDFIDPSGRVTHQIYFSADHGYTPVRFDYIKSDKIVMSVDVLGLREISDGIWFPFKGQIKSDSNEWAEVYEAKTVILNQGLTDEDFDFEFPPGTRINDEITNLQYIIRPNEEQFNKWLNDEEIISRIKSNNTPKASICRDKINDTNKDSPKNVTSSTTEIQPKYIDDVSDKAEVVSDKTRSRTLWALIIFPAIVTLVTLGIIRKARRGK